MSDEVNSQVTDAIVQVNTVVLGEAPAQALAQLYQTSAAATSIAIQNAVHAQNNQNAISNAATAEAVAVLLGKTSAAITLEQAPKADAVLARINELMELLQNKIGEKEA